MTYDVTGPVSGRMDEILTPDALRFLDDLHHAFAGRRAAVLERRRVRQAAFDQGLLPDFLPETSQIRLSEWQVARPPADLDDRRVEITGPVDRKMMINALNSGAKVFMADFEDATSPTWNNVIEGQVNVLDHFVGRLRLETEDKIYEVGAEPATLVVRPRGWHLPEKHISIDGASASASLVDFGLFVFHGGRAAVAAGSGPYLYLPKLESHVEARLWNDVFVFAQERLGLTTGTIRATVLIETLPAAFEMDEILYELREHSAGLNAGRWDYIFSVIKKLRAHDSKILPDRSQVTMTVPFMRAYTELMVATCHRRGAHAIGGMAAFIPNRRKPEVTAKALAAVAADKEREARQGCDGTWVAHPDLVSVAREQFDAVLGDAPNQLERLRPDVDVSQADLLATQVEGGHITLDGIRINVSVGIRYVAAWLSGTGAAAIDDLMEDAATAEISRSQVWQWLNNGVQLSDGQQVTRDLVERLVEEEMQAIEKSRGEAFASGRWDEARSLFVETSLADEYPDFLTLPAYARMP